MTSGGVLEITLVRERLRNALDLATTERLLRSLETARKDDGVRAVLLRGEGAGFCAGSDVKEMASASMDERVRIAERKAALMRALADLDKPVVCAVHGFALGGGFMLAIGCDVVVTASEAAWPTVLEAVPRIRRRQRTRQTRRGRGRLRLTGGGATGLH